MVYLRDKKNTEKLPDIWSWPELRDGVWYIVFEDGEDRKLVTSDVHVDRGKYAGTKLSELLDKGYLEWLSKLPNEPFINQMALLRLKEL